MYPELRGIENQINFGKAHKKPNQKSFLPSFFTKKRGIGSAGRAPALHAGGQEFESPILHHKKESSLRTLFFIANFPAVSGLFAYIILEENFLERIF